MTKTWIIILGIIFLLLLLGGGGFALYYFLFRNKGGKKSTGGTTCKAGEINVDNVCRYPITIGKLNPNNIVFYGCPMQVSSSLKVPTSKPSEIASYSVMCSVGVDSGNVSIRTTSKEIFQYEKDSKWIGISLYTGKNIINATPFYDYWLPVGSIIRADSKNKDVFAQCPGGCPKTK